MELPRGELIKRPDRSGRDFGTYLAAGPAQPSGSSFHFISLPMFCARNRCPYALAELLPDSSRPGARWARSRWLAVCLSVCPSVRLSVLLAGRRGRRAWERLWVPIGAEVLAGRPAIESSSRLCGLRANICAPAADRLLTWPTLSRAPFN